MPVARERQASVSSITVPPSSRSTTGRPTRSLSAASSSSSLGTSSARVTVELSGRRYCAAAWVAASRRETSAPAPALVQAPVRGRARHRPGCPTQPARTTHPTARPGGCRPARPAQLRAARPDPSQRTRRAHRWLQARCRRARHRPGRPAPAPRSGPDARSPRARRPGSWRRHPRRRSPA